MSSAHSRKADVPDPRQIDLEEYLKRNPEPPPKKISGLREETAQGGYNKTDGAKINKRISEKRQRQSVKTISEIQKSYSSRLRISLSTWRGKNNIEIRECSSVIADIYFPTSSGVTIEISKLPELIEALKVALTEAKKLGMLATAG